MPDRRPFAEDIPELEWERRNTFDHSLPGQRTFWALVGLDGKRIEGHEADLVRAGIRIGEERARKRIAEDMREHADFLMRSRDPQPFEIAEADVLRNYARDLEVDDA